MNTQAHARKLVRYGALSAALLLAAGSGPFFGVSARAESLTAQSCDNAPKTGAEFLSDQCDWKALERTGAIADEEPRAAPRRHQRRARALAPLSSQVPDQKER